MTKQAAEREKLLKAAWLAYREGRFPEAEQQLDDLLASGVTDARIWDLKTEVALRGGDLDASLEAVKQAVLLDPENSRYLVQQARCHCLAGQFEQARLLASQAAAAGIVREEDFVMLGGLLVRCEAYEEALGHFEKALSLNPDNTDAHRGLASVQRFFGNKKEAEKACDFVLARNPLDGEIQNLRSSLRPQTADENHIRELLDVVRSGRLDWRGAVQVAYALAKEYEDLGEWDKSFYHLENGARIRRMHTRYELQDDLKIFQAIEQAFDGREGVTTPEQACGSDVPIFIVGMPRTGSTLVERIISSHSRVSSAGELNEFATELVSLVDKKAGKRVDRLDLPAVALDLPMKELGEAYVRNVRKRAWESPRIIDKLPLNFLYLGYIHLALPKAKIVHVKRDPMDACYAIFKFLFNQAYPFSYDLEELGEYYAAYHRLMALWRRILPSAALIEISYEDLVAHQEEESRKLIAALGLEWEDVCLEFHKNAAASTTGSASQVRNKIYDSSVGRWRCYEKQLLPLRKKLKHFGLL
ncbi:tetratricopeptide repeat-containing sulfotransferase family protein [Emcibacter nanhaiensis]|uniref:Tetratricopeptide repeat protein n=1 Tax=Emcibacter nanhaiensis TaxID=1505037 RepID=A0A501PKE3_9PROT|nr:sulfotransferase [Emcibacter nanhaiensis]TPD60186.1 tetratricopeptide repeat protein [Emcibacter nanhaiensis]